MTSQKLKELYSGMVNEMDKWKEMSVETGLEIETLKEDVKTYKKYHSDKCDECEEQRERADYNEKEMMRLKKENEALKKQNWELIQKHGEWKRTHQLQKKIVDKQRETIRRVTGEMSDLSRKKQALEKKLPRRYQ